VYEQIRRRRKVITFDDMLMMGWEMLVRYPGLLQTLQKLY
jgi:DNA helicase-2/ATP-dependent DNA helicase PcrA